MRFLKATRTSKGGSINKRRKGKVIALDVKVLLSDTAVPHLEYDPLRLFLSPLT